MGKRKIANKFASVKRIISSQDDRMYSLSQILVNKTKPNSNNNNVNVANYSKNKLLMMLRLNKCNFIVNKSPK